MSPNAQSLWVCMGHHKCASTTQHRLFSEICTAAGRRAGYIGNVYPESLQEFIQENAYDAISLGNADPVFLHELNNFKGFHLIRDPRDIIISAYYSHRYSHPTDGWEDMARHRELLNSMPEDEGLLLELDFWPTKVTIERMSEWNYKDSRILECRFEDFITDVSSWVRKLCEHWDISIVDYPGALNNLTSNWNVATSKIRGIRRASISVNKLSKNQITEIASKISFKSLSGGRGRGEKDKKSHYRSGKPGEWRKHFTPRLKAAFLERFPDVLNNTNYPDFD